MFVKHLQKLFEPFESQATKEKTEEIIPFLESPFHMEVPIEKINEVRNETNINKAPGFNINIG